MEHKQKKNILFVCPYPINEAPSQRFRFEQYLDLLKQQDYTYKFAPFYTKKGYEALYKKGSLLAKLIAILIGFTSRKLLLFRLRKYDFIFIHREATPAGPPFFEWVVKKIWRKKIIYDFDDAIWLSDNDEIGSFKALIKWKSKVGSICKWSYKVSCGNEFLADYARKFNEKVVVNPTTIDLAYHKPKQNLDNKEKLIVGWTGTHSTLYYLNSISEQLNKAYQQKAFQLLVIANKAPEFKFPDLQFIPWSKSTEIELLNKIDVGLMPLTDDAWSQGKCGFKALQYMALKKPVLASPVGVNINIVPHGGVLIHNKEDWSTEILSLLINEKNRNTLGEEGHMYVKNNYSTKSNANNFLYLFR